MIALIAAAVLGTTGAATVAGAAGGYTAWSELASGGRYVLVVRAPNGSISRPPVAPRSVPFDLDLGVADPGAVVAAYSRCDSEPPARGGANTIGPQYALGRGCSIYVLNLATGTEVAVAGAAGVLPSVGGGMLAYVEKGNGRASLVTRPLSGGTPRRVDSGPLHAAGSSKLFEGPTSVDTDGRRVAAAWRFFDVEFGSSETQVRTVAIGGGKPAEVASASIIEDCRYETLISPTLSGGSALYLDTKGSVWGLGSTPATRFRPTFGAHANPRGWVPTSAAVDGQRLVLSETRTRLRGRSTGTTRIVERPIGRFVPRTPVACG